MAFHSQPCDDRLGKRAEQPEQEGWKEGFFADASIAAAVLFMGMIFFGQGGSCEGEDVKLSHSPASEQGIFAKGQQPSSSGCREV
eukprot:113195-Hanusia_phi.AAC.1